PVQAPSRGLHARALRVPAVLRGRAPRTAYTFCGDSAAAPTQRFRCPRRHGKERASSTKVFGRGATDTMPAMEALDPAHLAERQLELDHARTARFSDLFARKMVRMSASPLAFLRGAAPLFYEILHTRHDLSDGPAGDGWLVGDAHLENFGAYRPDPY